MSMEDLETFEQHLKQIEIDVDILRKMITAQYDLLFKMDFIMRQKDIKIKELEDKVIK